MENKIEIIVVAFGSIGRRLFNTVWLTFSNFTTYNSYALFSYFVDPTLEVSDLGEVKSLNQACPTFLAQGPNDKFRES